ncbi:MAG: Lipase EstA [Candidatus Anoxychlamydiales bacterium]|nr:Lipase EstA [Candidatus Anoxychlamydiales bacterium]
MIISTIVWLKDGVSLTPLSEKISKFETIKRRILFDYEILVKEFSFVITSIYHFAISFFQNYYSKKPTLPKDIQETTKVCIFIHGLGGGSFNFHFLAKKLYNAGFENLYAIDYTRKNGTIPIDELNVMIEDIAKKSFQNKAKKLDITLIGHSLGGAISLKYLLNKENKQKDIKISNIISISGVLKFHQSKFSWLCKDMKSDLDKIDSSHTSEGLNGCNLYSFRGEKDRVIPKEATFIQKDEKKEFSYSHLGHGNIILSNKVANKIIELLNKN